MKFYFVVCFAHESISDDAPMVGEYESDVTRRITRAVESVFFKDAWQMENARSRGLAKKKKKKNHRDAANSCCNNAMECKFPILCQ